MSNSSGEQVKKPAREKLDIRWEQELLDDLREMKKLSGDSMASIVHKALRKYITAEKPRLLARLRKQLSLVNHRN